MVPVSSYFVPVQGGRISAQIVDQILVLIRGGQLKPGDRLPAERELVETFGVSRVTVRDALRVLEVMGLVEIRVGSAGGAFVTTPSADVIGKSVSNMLQMRGFEPSQIAEARLVVELGIFDLVIERITEEDILTLREICAESRKRFEAGEYDTALSVQFHSALAACAGNPAITVLSESFSGPLSLAAVRATEVRDNRHERTVVEHSKIVDALAAGDGPTAREHLIQHLLRGRAASDGSHRLLRQLDA